MLMKNLKNYKKEQQKIKKKNLNQQHLFREEKKIKKTAIICDVDGTVAKKTNSFKTVEEYFVAECAKKHGDGHGRLIVGGHHVINGVATSQADYPTDANTKAEIKDFYDKRGVAYGGSETKTELLSRITFTSGPYRAKHLRS